MIDDAQYEKIRQDSHVWYKNQSPVNSPALNQLVYFTAEAFEHTKYKRARAERDKPSQIMRLKMLPRAFRLIELSTTIQEYEEIVKVVSVKRRKKRVHQSKQIQYWGLIAIIENRKIKVILRKIGNGQLQFWSIIPAWTTNKYRDTKFVSTMKGLPEED